MRVLVACEESQTVTKELRKLGHEAYSCDLEPCSGGHPEWHLQQDATLILKEKWDMVIAHPPCTYLSHAGARWLYPNGQLNRERLQNGLKGKEFFEVFLHCDCPRVAIENPLPSAIYGLPAPTQIIQPWMFGDEAQKKTLLWLRGLPPLLPTEIVGRGERVVYSSGKTKAKWFMDAAQAPTAKERAKIRSKTFPGIAKAMATQWAGPAFPLTRPAWLEEA